VAKLTRLTHKIAIQLHLVAESCSICTSRSRRPVRKLLDTHSYVRARAHNTYIHTYIHTCTHTHLPTYLPTYRGMHGAFSSRYKVQLPLCFTKHHTMKTYWGSGGIAPHILELCIRWTWVNDLLEYFDTPGNATRHKIQAAPVIPTDGLL
jgi:hypothetical protein